MRLAMFSVIALLTFGATVAQADSFSFSFGKIGDPMIGSGTLDGNLTSSGDYAINSIQGTTSYPGSGNLDIIGLLSAGTYQNNDNLLIPSASGYGFDANGLSYFLSNATEINLYTDPVGGDNENYMTISSGFDSQFVPVIITNVAPTLTPEPASLVLLGSGLIGTVGFVRRRR